MQEFFDPDPDPLLKPHNLVPCLTLGGLRRNSLEVQRKVLLVFTEPDLKRAAKLGNGRAQIGWRPYRRLYRCEGFTLALSPVGAPNVVALAEELFAFGGRVFVLFGYCGALQEMQGGDVLLPVEALREEGTSYHYMPPDERALASEELVRYLETFFRKGGLEPHIGKVWTTDALYRETRDKIRRYKAMGYAAVEMETSALFSWASARGVRAGSVLVVSDRFIEEQWEPYFGHPRFVIGRRKALGLTVEALKELCP